MKRKPKPVKADVFSVWGKPPKALVNVLGPESEKALKRYVGDIVARCYRIAFDNGRERGIEYGKR